MTVVGLKDKSQRLKVPRKLLCLRSAYREELEIAAVLTSTYSSSLVNLLEDTLLTVRRKVIDNSPTSRSCGSLAAVATVDEAELLHMQPTRLLLLTQPIQ